MTTNDDQLYINKVIAGDTNAFAMLVERYKDLVFTLALRMLKHREEAEEASQDTFIKAFKSIKKFKGDSKFSTWIYRVAYNTCLDRIKKNKRLQQVDTINEFTEHKIQTIDNALHNLEAKERKASLLKCLEYLPADDSALLNLFYFEELSLEEISEIIGLKPNHIKVKLHRSRKKLFGILTKHIEPEILESYGKAHG